MRYTPGNGEYCLTDRERDRLLRRLNKESHKSWDNYGLRRRRWDFVEAFVDGRQVFDGTGAGPGVADSGGAGLVGWDLAMAPSATNDVDDKKYIFNKARRIHVSNMQRLTAYDIDVNVLPNTKTPKDKSGARLGRLVLSTIIAEADPDRLRRDIAWYLDLRGTAFLKHWFDPMAGPLVHPLHKNKLTGEVEVDESRREPAGAVRWVAVDPACILLPEGCERLEEADWLEEYEVLSIGEIFRRTKVKVEKEVISFDEGRLRTGADWRQGDLQFKNHAVLRTRYYRPDPTYSKGAIFTYTTKNLIRSTELKKFYDDIPYSQCHGIYNPKSPFGETWLWDIIPACIGENVAKTALLNYMELLPKLNMQAPVSARFKTEKFNSGSGNIHLYQGEKGMEPLQLPALPESVIQGMNIMEQSSMTLGASQDISRANRAYSGNAISTLQQIDDSAFRPTLTSIESMLRSASRFSLPVVAKFYTVPRTVRLTGMKAWEVEEAFTGNMLEENYQAEINLMTGRPTNSVLQREDIYKAHEAELITAEEARAQLEFGSKFQIWEDLQKAQEIVDRYCEDLNNYPENYGLVQSPGDPARGIPPGQVMQCKTPFADYYDPKAMLDGLDAFLRENGAHIQEQVVKETFRKHRYYYQDVLRVEEERQAALQGGVPRGTGKPAKPDGNQPAEKGQLSLPLRDGNHSPEEQPDRGHIPEPGNTGLTV